MVLKVQTQCCAGLTLIFFLMSSHLLQPQGCVDVSYKTLCEEENDLYFEMEMYIPEEHAVAAIKKWNEWQAMVAPTWTDEGNQNTNHLLTFLVLTLHN